MYLAYASVGALYYTVVLITETTELLAGGGGDGGDGDDDDDQGIQPEEYMYAALSLYMDIINIFRQILRIMNAIDI